MSNTLTYYLSMALEKAGVEVNGDMLSEMEGITQDFEDRLDGLSKRITALEAPKPAAEVKPAAAKAQAEPAVMSAAMAKAAGWWKQFSTSNMRFALHVQLATAVSAFEDEDDDGGKFAFAMESLKEIATEAEWIVISDIVDAMSEAVTKYPKGLDLNRDYASYVGYILISHRNGGLYALVNKVTGAVQVLGSRDLFYTGAIEAAALILKEAAALSATIMAKAN